MAPLTVEAKSGYALDETGEMNTLVVMAAIDGQPLDIVPTYLARTWCRPSTPRTPTTYIEWMYAEMMPRIRRQRLALFADIYLRPAARSHSIRRAAIWNALATWGSS